MASTAGWVWGEQVDPMSVCLYAVGASVPGWLRVVRWTSNPPMCLLRGEKTQ